MAKSVSYWIASLVVAVPLGLYSAFLGLGSIPFFQRHFLYAHKIHTLWWHEINEPTQWGFAKNQVTPFSLPTADGEVLYAWHILPLPLYGQHEAVLSAQSTGFCKDITQTENFRLLREDPTSRLVIYLHGNAGHIAQAIRPPSYHALTDTSAYHVLAIDYRGFGRSTGSPSETGLILDATAAVEWAMNVTGVPADRIVLLGHSLGTAVASAVAEFFAKEGVDFAGVVLVSAFSSLPKMLSGYAIAGWVPVLAPFRAWPWVLKQVEKCIVDRWQSSNRLEEVVRTVKARNGRLRLHLIHAANDWDIPCHEDDILFAAAVNGRVVPGGDGMLTPEQAMRTFEKGENTITTPWKDAFVAEWAEQDIVVRREVFPYGGHNDIMYYSPMLLAVMRSFGIVDEVVVSPA
ncbi:Alpha/Beta hydrolase protein [Lasiosphaeria miniovina]|uniref:Alpha/Beta hydrolase protein n=1 Tax=Lasiosphaeria miniovina TaxID=1954250 RepID=A0AA40DUK7_9PEZI|nr:Alpha/Beta hydrolase protein [Lasiosphaeria miniovina]KAK0713977.1 Alpha/Beta hydrolase protein [Lasiosphaeria miniovina]